MPYTPPSASLKPPPLPERNPNAMSFGKRLMLTPLWFIVGLLPVWLVTLAASMLLSSDGMAVGMVLTILTVAYFIYRWLVRGLNWTEERRKVMAWAGVPLVIVAWGAFLFAVLFAMCAGMGGLKLN